MAMGEVFINRKSYKTYDNTLKCPKCMFSFRLYKTDQ